MAHPSQQKQLDELFELIEDIEIAMFTTRRADGRLVSRPMATQKRDPVADLWFVTDIDSDKMEELAGDSNVNLGYLNERMEWVSVSGTAKISTDRALIRKLYQPDWKAWFGEIDKVRDGGPNDPRLALILVDAERVMYLKHAKAKPLILFEVVKGMITGKQPDVGEVKTLEVTDSLQK